MNGNVGLKPADHLTDPLERKYFLLAGRHKSWIYALVRSISSPHLRTSIRQDPMRTIVWFRQDLRRSDNPALSAAAARGAVVPVFILDETAPEPRLGGASRWWLHHSLAALRDDLGDLVLFKGEPRKIIGSPVEQKIKAFVISSSSACCLCSRS
jgi:hypothetical protein